MDRKGIRFGILTVSDSCYRGEREDLSGREVREVISGLGEVKKYGIVPDDEDMIRNTLLSWCGEVDIILTTGGTGFSGRDRTPEATLKVIERECPGLSEIMRVRGYERTPFSVLSRGVCGIRGGTLIINLPGSPRGARESLEIILPVLSHAVHILRGGGHEV